MVQTAEDRHGGHLGLFRKPMSGGHRLIDACAQASPAATLQGDIEQSPKRYRSGVDHGSKGLPDHELGRDLGDTVVGADVVDAADVSMVQRRGCGRFLLETGEATNIGGDPLRAEP